ncbi:unnamed protein product [Brassicogethes aeneus]|uniref:G-protein coupled receptors family 2 profile 2 domain-containing protein n=1 Tax=Brassicogethes aeneus TaxID=1431903 RepID=A0A9P0FD90_BRAAE|nr:unnamed protein product [Brassicogethes aeneus]
MFVLKVFLLLSGLVAAQEVTHLDTTDFPENVTSLLARENQGQVQPSSILHISKELASPQLPGFDSSDLQFGPILVLSNYDLYLVMLEVEDSDTTGYFIEEEECPQYKVDVSVLSYFKEIRISSNIHSEKPLQEISNLCVYSNSYNNLVGSVRINVTESVSKYGNKTEILRLPKCCPVDHRLVENSCTPAVFDMDLRINIFNNNSTHYDDVPMNTDLFTVIPFYYPLSPSCQYRYRLIHSSEDPENFDKYDLLRNGSLITGTEILVQDRFCVETDDENTAVFVCVPETPKIAGLANTIYIILLFVSLACFIFVSVVYYLCFDSKQTHKQMFTCLAASMVFKYIFLIILYYKDYCSVLGYFVQFFEINAYIWLLLLCLDSIYLIYIFPEKGKRGRLYYYCAPAFILPLIIVLITIIVIESPNLPSGLIRVRENNECYLQETTVWLYTVPSALLIVLSIVCIVILIVKVRIVNKEQECEYDWVENKVRFNFLWRSQFILAVIMVIPLVNSYLNKKGLATNLGVAFHTIIAAEGLIVASIFCFSRIVQKELLKLLFPRKRERTNSLQDAYKELEKLQITTTAFTELNNTDNLTN